MNEKMAYRKIPHVNKPVSRIVFGTGIKSMWNNEDKFELLDAVYAAGINTFDTAAVYGDAEASFGRWLKTRNLRKEVVILTKGANPNQYRNRVTEYDIMSDIEDSFVKLQTDYIDIYLLHRDDPSVPVESIVELLNKLHEQGCIGAFGGSNWTLERMIAANDYAEKHGLIPFSINSPSYGLMEFLNDPWGGSVTISGSDNANFRSWLREKNISVFAYSSLGRGFLSGRLKSTDTDPEKARSIVGAAYDEYGFTVNYEKLARVESLAKEKGVTVPQIGFAWLMQQELDVFGVTSPGTPSHIAETVDALNLVLSDRELKWLNKEID